MANVEGEWSKLVLGAPKETHHAPAGFGDYGFYRAKWKQGGITVVAEAYPDFDRSRWLWGVKFPAQAEMRSWNPDLQQEVVTREERREWRTGGHAPTLKEAQIAAEAAVRAGRP